MATTVERFGSVNNAASPIQFGFEKGFAKDWTEADGKGCMACHVDPAEDVAVSALITPVSRRAEGAGARSVLPTRWLHVGPSTTSMDVVPQFSPDDRWVAYASDEAGTFNIADSPYEVGLSVT